MKLKHLEAELQQVKTFLNPKIELEQYPTTPHLAANMIHLAHSFGDIEGKVVCDLGSGCGVLSVASMFMGSCFNFCVDVDSDAQTICLENFETIFEEFEVDLVLSDATKVTLRADTVIMNPPFGTRKKNIDTAFVRKGLEIASVVYSMHKTSTRAYLQKEFGGKVLAEMEFDIPKMYKFHKENNRSVKVDLWRFERVY